MTEEQFKEFAERIASEDETRIALRNAFRWEIGRASCRERV